MRSGWWLVAWQGEAPVARPRPRHPRLPHATTHLHPRLRVAKSQDIVVSQLHGIACARWWRRCWPAAQAGIRPHAAHPSASPAPTPPIPASPPRARRTPLTAVPLEDPTSRRVQEPPGLRARRACASDTVVSSRMQTSARLARPRVRSVAPKGASYLTPAAGPRVTVRRSEACASASGSELAGAGPGSAWGVGKGGLGLGERAKGAKCGQLRWVRAWADDASGRRGAGSAGEWRGQTARAARRPRPAPCLDSAARARHGGLERRVWGVVGGRGLRQPQPAHGAGANRARCGRESCYVWAAHAAHHFHPRPCPALSPPVAAGGRQAPSLVSAASVPIQGGRCSPPPSGECARSVPP